MSAVYKWSKTNAFRMSRCEAICEPRNHAHTPFPACQEPKLGKVEPRINKVLRRRTVHSQIPFGHGLLRSGQIAACLKLKRASLCLFLWKQNRRVYWKAIGQNQSQWGPRGMAKGLWQPANCCRIPFDKIWYPHKKKYKNHMPHSIQWFKIHVYNYLWTWTCPRWCFGLCSLVGSGPPVRRWSSCRCTGTLSPANQFWAERVTKMNPGTASMLMFSHHNFNIISSYICSWHTTAHCIP